AERALGEGAVRGPEVRDEDGQGEPDHFSSGPLPGLCEVPALPDGAGDGEVAELAVVEGPASRSGPRERTPRLCLGHPGRRTCPSALGDRIPADSSPPRRPPPPR